MSLILFKDRMDLALFKHVSVVESIWNVDIAIVNQSEKVELKTNVQSKIAVTTLAQRERTTEEKKTLGRKNMRWS